MTGAIPIQPTASPEPSASPRPELQHYLRKLTGRADDFAISGDAAAAKGDLILIGGPATNAVAGGWPRPSRSTRKNWPRSGRKAIASRRGTVAGATRAADRRRQPRRHALRSRTICSTGWAAAGLPRAKSTRKCRGSSRIGDFDVTERPAFLTRGFLAWEDRGNPDFLLWMARNRLDYWCDADKHHALMHKLGIRMVAGLHDAEPMFLHPSAPYPYAHPLFPANSDKPKDPYPVSPLYQGDADKDGKLSYFEAHPEWFALCDGKRVPGMQDAKQNGANFCMSNPDATTEFIKNHVQALIDGPYRDADMVRFWTIEHARWCECAECKALGTPTDQYLLLVHRLGQEIKKARAAGKIRRPIEIRLLAYDETLLPPTRPLPADFDYATCAVTFFPIERCYVHNFDDPNCRLRDTDAPNPRATNAHYVGRSGPLGHGPRIGSTGARLPSASITTCRATQACRSATCTRWPTTFRTTITTGARHFDYMHVTTGNWGNKALTNYQMARQLWDVRTDCDELWKDYFAGRYGPAAGVMRRFYESLERMFSNISELKCGTPTRLARRLDAGQERLFVNAHLQFQREPGVVCDGPTLTEIVGYSADCRKLIDEAMKMELPPQSPGADCRGRANVHLR